MTIDFAGQKVLVTGGTRGIGRKIAEAFAHNGADVILTGTGPNTPQWIEELHITYEQLRIGDPNWRQTMDTIIEKHRYFDICINNAGINKISPIHEIASNDLNTILLTNLNAPIFIASKVSQTMIPRQRGYIINIASIFGVVSKKGRSAYTASKSGLIGATRSMAIDLAEHGILVNAVSPGFVDTELTRQVLGEEGVEQMRAKIPMKKLANTADIVPMVLFLSSSLNTYLTGQNIIIDGGFTLE